MRCDVMKKSFVCDLLQGRRDAPRSLCIDVQCIRDSVTRMQDRNNACELLTAVISPHCLSGLMKDVTFGVERGSSAVVQSSMRANDVTHAEYTYIIVTIVDHSTMLT